MMSCTLLKESSEEAQIALSQVTNGEHSGYVALGCSICMSE